MSSLKCSTDCALTKCSDYLFHNFTVEGKNECKYELILADGILNLCTCPLVEVHNGIKLKDGIIYSKPSYNFIKHD